MFRSVGFKSRKNGSDPGTECMVSVKCEISLEDEITIESKQDQFRVEREAHVERGSSPLVGGIAASLIITRAT